MALPLFLQVYSKEIFSLVVPIVGWFISRQFSEKAKLVNSVRHEFTFLVQEPLYDQDGEVILHNQAVHVASISLTNIGRVSATHVEVLFNWKPQFYNLWPLRTYEERAHPDGRFSIVLPNLSPKESFSVELLSINQKLPELCNIRSQESTSRFREMQMRPVYSQWVNIVFLWLFLVGLIGSVWLILSALELAVPADLTRTIFTSSKSPQNLVTSDR